MTCSDEVFDLIESGYQLKSEIYEMKEKSLKIRVEKVELNLQNVCPILSE